MEPIKPKKAYELVVERIQNMIVDGELKKGQKLMTEREMSVKLEVSRPTVREALRALEVIGLIESRHGEGNFVKESFKEALIKPLSLVFILENSEPKDILELRKMIEIKTASMAAENRTEEEMEHLKDLFNQFKEETDQARLITLDNEFHSCLAHITRNQLVISMYDAMSVLMENFTRDIHKIALVEYLEGEVSKNYILEQHQGILDAIIEGDGNKASESMLKHLEFIEKSILGL
jgi:GntR family transcriptional repressor for pyruvate dehydrogenase complex